MLYYPSPEILHISFPCKSVLSLTNAIVSLVGDACVYKWAIGFMIKEMDDSCAEGACGTGKIRPVQAILSESLLFKWSLLYLSNYYRYG